MIDAVSEKEKDVVRGRASLLAVIYNANGNTKKGTESGFETEDFLPDELKEKKKALTLEQYWDAMCVANAALGGKMEVIQPM